MSWEGVQIRENTNRVLILTEKNKKDHSYFINSRCRSPTESFCFLLCFSFHLADSRTTEVEESGGCWRMDGWEEKEHGENEDGVLEEGAAHVR